MTPCETPTCKKPAVLRATRAGRSACPRPQGGDKAWCAACFARKAAKYALTAVRVGRVLLCGICLACASRTGTGTAHAASLTLTWQDQSPDECGFYVERHIAGAALWDKIAYLNAHPGSTGAVTYIDSNLTAGLRYYYQVHAWHQGGPSMPSNIASGIATAPDPIAPPPTNKQPAPIGPCPRLTLSP